MKNISKKIAGFILTSMLVFTSCETDLDINKDPDLLSPNQIPMAAELPAAQTGIAGATGSYLAIAGGFWSQYWTQSAVANQYKQIDDYTITSSNALITGFWANMYDALTDVRNIKANAAAQNNWNYYLIATTLEVYSAQILVDMFGSIPYTESNNPAILNPQFEEASVVYDKMVADLNEALAKNFDESPVDNVPGSTDLIFGGDMAKWKQFANTVLLKVYMRQSAVRPAVAQAGINSLLSSGAQFLTSDAAITQFKDEDSRSNPLYESDRRQLNVGTNLRASQTLGGYLSTNGDPRLSKFYNGSTFQIQGNFDKGSGTASVVTLSATDAVYFISKAESYFLQAEASVRYAGGTTAKSLYESGVNAAFAKYSLSATALLGGNYAYPNGTTNDNLKAILTQKWISNFPGNGYESFIEQNRTGIPKKSTVAQTSASYVPGEFVYGVEGKTGGKFPRRFEYPSTELRANSNAPKTIISITEAVWYDKN